MRWRSREYSVRSAKFSIIIALLMASVCSAQELLDEQVVDDFSQQVQGFIISKNADGLASAFSQNATITVDMPKNAGGTSVSNKTQFTESLKRGWSNTDTNL